MRKLVSCLIGPIEDPFAHPWLRSTRPLAVVPFALAAWGFGLFSNDALGQAPGETAAAHEAGKGPEYFVAPRGDDNGPGTRDAPWATIQKACETVEAGATVLVLEGEYREMVYVEVEGNAEQGPVTIRAEGKVVVSVDGVADAEHVFYIEDKSYLKIIGFEMTGLTTKDGSGIRYEGSGSHLEFRDNVIHGMRGKNAMGITVYATSAETPVTQLAITGNKIFDCDAAPSEALVINGNVDGFEISYNDVHDINNIGIDMIGGERDIVDDPDAVVRNGICRGNQVMRARSSYGGGFAAGIYVDGGRDIVIERNVIAECDMGIEIGAENRGLVTTGIVVRNNVLAGNDKAGLVFGGYGKGAGRVEGCRFLNNLIAGNTSHKKAQAELWIQWASSNVVKNNIIVGTVGADLPLLAFESKGSGDNTLDYNCWYHPDGVGEEGDDRFVWRGKGNATLAEFQSATGQSGHSKWGDPKFGKQGYSLLPDSPCFDQGDPAYHPGPEVLDITGQARVSGQRVDIGPYEIQLR